LRTLTIGNTTETLLEPLIESLFHEIQESGNLLYKPIVIVPNGNLKNFLLLTLANHPDYRIASGIEMISIETYLKKSLDHGQKLVDETLFGLFILEVWKENKEQFPRLGKILLDTSGKESDKKRLDLALALGNLLVRYQKELGSEWAEIVYRDHEYYKEEKILYELVIRKLEKIFIKGTEVVEFIPYGFLPEIVNLKKQIFNQPIHILGATNLIYLHLESLKNLHHDLHFYQLYPYSSKTNPWSGPIINVLEERMDYILKHLHLVLEKTTTEPPPKSKTNLQLFQDILVGKSIEEPSTTDLSLQVIIAPSLKREVESIHAHILSLLETDPTLSPNDFLILLPNLNLYANTIYSVFSKKNRILFENGRYSDKILPFILTDEAAGKESSYYHAVRDLFLLGLSDSLNRRNCITLLRHSGVQKALKLASSDLKYIYDWFDTYHFYSDLSDREQTPDLREREKERKIFSLDLLLKRIRLGFLVPPDSDIILESDEGIPFQPKSNLQRDQIIVLEKLHIASQKWERWRSLLKDPSPSLEELLFQIEDNLIPDNSIPMEVKSYQKLRSTLLDYSRYFSGRLTAIEIQRLILDLLGEDKETKTGILENGVTISGIQPVRPIPFPHVYVLGLNQGNFGVNPEKSPFDLSMESKQENDFKIMQSDEAAKTMLLESILSARTRLTLSFVVQDAPEEIKFLLEESGKQDQNSAFSLLRYEKEMVASMKEKMTVLLSKTGNILGSLLNTAKSNSLDIPITPLPLSRLSKFYFYKNSKFAGDFLQSSDGKKAITVHYKSEEVEQKYKKSEKEYLEIFHLRKRSNNTTENIKGLEPPTRLRLKSLATFLLDPFEDYLQRLEAKTYDININPNLDTDPYELDAKFFRKKILPYLEKSHHNLISVLKNQIPLWKAGGELPLGNWGESEDSFQERIENLLEKVLSLQLDDPHLYELKNGILYKNKNEFSKPESLQSHLYLTHEWKVRNNSIFRFFMYSKDISTKIALKDFLADGMGQFLVGIDVHLTYKFSFKDGEKLKIIHYPKSTGLSIDPSKLKTFQILFQELLKEYLDSPFPYYISDLDIKDYRGNLDNIDDLFIKSGWSSVTSSYESIQRNSQNLILGDRVPNSKTPQTDLDRLNRLLQLQFNFLELFGLREQNEMKDMKPKKGKNK
jgi:hypothetical protein